MKQRVKAVIFAVLTLTVILGSVFLEAPGRGNITSVAALAHKETDRIKLAPGGVAFGVKFFTKGALVVGITDIETAQGLSSPARDAGLEIKDIITSIEGKDIRSAEEFRKVISDCGGNCIEMKYMRNGTESSISVTPVIDKTDNTYKVGIWVRDSTAGIGTITFVDKKTGSFGGLGHGINDSETGVLLPLDKGIIVDVAITDIVIGKKNSPGELKGRFDRVRKGELSVNCDAGVFGRLDEIPENIGEELPIGFREELRTGKAYIITTLDEGKPERFEIEIEKIFEDAGETKNFMIKVTDSALISRAGGIVQGMSGSPIIKDGKLIGAVTHVLVGDSTRGYGIHIENMINRMN